VKKTPLAIKPGDEIEVAFETMALGGRAKGTPVDAEPGSCAVFTDLAAPGDVAKVRVTRVVKRFVEAELVEVLQPGPDRVEPVCPYFGVCGGCNWQHLSYERQLKEKAEIVSYVFSRNKMPKGLVQEVYPSEKPIGYRSRADMTFMRHGSELQGGFLRRGSHNLLDIESCALLADELSNAIPRFKAALSAVLADAPADRTIKVRVLTDEANEQLYAQIKDATYRLEGEALVPAEDTILSFEVDGSRLEYSPECFTQVNFHTNRDLVAATIEALAPGPEDRILELYAGIGNFTMAIAKRAGSVLANEASPVSSKFSVHNAKKLGLSNIQHVGGNADRACRKLAKQGARFAKVLLDPPRAGMGEEAVNALADLEPELIVSISCHPDRLAKDLACFAFRGYSVESIQAFDMFGQTFHCETLTVLRKN
jgi:23S rRNA (uracil1939-C5)-methyltransferase